MNTNIAVIGFGSIVHNLYSPVYKHTLQIEGEFSFPDKKELSLPIRMSRLSSAGTENRRITVVVDPQASAEPVAVACSAKHTLPDAIEDLRKREGTIREHICYLAKSHFNEDSLPFPDRVIIEKEQYKGKLAGRDTRYKLKDMQAHIIANWLGKSDYQAIIWTGLPPNIETGPGVPGARGREILPLLQADPVLLTNTQRYIAILPEIFKTALQREISAMELENSGN